MCRHDSKAVILRKHEPLEMQSVQAVYQTVYKNTLYSIPTVITKVQLINLMSKVSNRFRHHNTLRETMRLEKERRSCSHGSGELGVLGRSIYLVLMTRCTNRYSFIASACEFQYTHCYAKIVFWKKMYHHKNPILHFFCK